MKRLLVLLAIVLVTAGVYALEAPVATVLFDRRLVFVNDSTATGASAETTITEEPFIIPNYRLYTIVTRLNAFSQVDSTICMVVVHTRVGDRGTWLTACSTLAVTTGETWKSFPLFLEADTALAKSRHIGDQMRVQVIFVDSAENVTHTNLYHPEVVLLGRY